MSLPFIHIWKSLEKRHLTVLEPVSGENSSWPSTLETSLLGFNSSIEVGDLMSITHGFCGNENGHGGRAGRVLACMVSFCRFVYF